ncbi:hypothetical protein GCM10027299_22100 [Larkinella ripae]
MDTLEKPKVSVNEYFVNFIDDHDGVETVAKLSGINRQTLRQAYLGRNGISSKVTSMLATTFKDFEPERVFGIVQPSKSLTAQATGEPGDNRVQLLEARVKHLEETLEEKKKTIKEREAMIKFLAATHPEFKEQLESLGFNLGVTKERFKNRGPIHKNEECFLVTWPQDQPEPDA